MKIYAKEKFISTNEEICSHGTRETMRRKEKKYQVKQPGVNVQSVEIAGHSIK